MTIIEFYFILRLWIGFLAHILITNEFFSFTENVNPTFASKIFDPKMKASIALISKLKLFITSYQSKAPSLHLNKTFHPCLKAVYIVGVRFANMQLAISDRAAEVNLVVDDETLE